MTKISKEKQIEEMAEILAKDCGRCDICKWLGHGNEKVACLDLYYAEQFYNAGYRKQSEGEWISVEERVPDENGRFLTVDEKGDMMVCFWEKHFGWFAMVCNKNAITHWMPLPEPPGMKGGE